MLIYKIRNKKTGEFSRGKGFYHGGWSKTGKTWNAQAHLSSHLSGKDPYNRSSDVEIVIYEIVERETIPLEVWLDDLEERRTKRNQKAEQRLAVWELSKKKLELEHLQQRIQLLSEQLGEQE